MPKPAARAENLTKIYGQGAMEVVALRSVSVSLVQGEFTAIMGPSGSGKSTLMRLIGDLERVKSVLLARLMGNDRPEDDRLLEADDAAPLLGVSRASVYRNADTYPFTVRPSSGRVRFSARGIQEWLERQRGAARRRKAS